MAEQTERKHIFTEGDRVWFEIGNSDYQGEVVEDDGGLEVMIDIDGGPIMGVYHTIITVFDESD